VVEKFRVSTRIITTAKLLQLKKDVGSGLGLAS